MTIEKNFNINQKLDQTKRCYNCKYYKPLEKVYQSSGWCKDNRENRASIRTTAVDYCEYFEYKDLTT